MKANLRDGVSFGQSSLLSLRWDGVPSLHQCSVCPLTSVENGILIDQAIASVLSFAFIGSFGFITPGAMGFAAGADARVVLPFASHLKRGERPHAMRRVHALPGAL